MEHLKKVVSHFRTDGAAAKVEPFGNGWINDSYLVDISGSDKHYVLQRINHNVFKDVPLLQRNMEIVTQHIRNKLEQKDIERRVLRLIEAEDGCSFYHDGENYWRMTAHIPGSVSFEAVTPRYARYAGEAFGQFQQMLSDLPVALGDTIPDFHNMEFRLEQLREAVAADAARRLKEVAGLVEYNKTFAE